MKYESQTKFFCLMLMAAISLTLVNTSRAQFELTRKMKGPEARVTNVQLKADNARPTGPCPITVNFTGYIKASGPGAVTYTFTRSDGATAPVYSLEFKEAGIQEVRTSWTLGDATALPSYNGWQAIRILSPNELESSHETGSFALSCAGGKDKPDIRFGPPTPFTVMPTPTPRPAVDENSAQINRVIEKQRQDEKARRAHEAEIIKSFADRLAPAIEAAERKIGFDRRAIEQEFKAIAAEPDQKQRVAKYEEARRKFEPQIVKLYEAAGIDVAAERQRLINALGLQKAKIKPSKTLTLEIEPEPIPQPSPGMVEAPPAALRYAHTIPQTSYVYNFTKPFLSAGTSGDFSEDSYQARANPGRGEIEIHHALPFVSSVATSAFILSQIEAKPAERRIFVTAYLKPLNLSLSANSFIAGYASSEAFASIWVIDPSRLDLEGAPQLECAQRISLGRVIAVVWAFPSYESSSVMQLRCGFERGASERRYQIKTMVELESGNAGASWVYSWVSGTVGAVTARTFAR